MNDLEKLILYTWNIEVCIEIVWITSKIKSREGILFYLC